MKTNALLIFAASLVLAACDAPQKSQINTLSTYMKATFSPEGLNSRYAGATSLSHTKQHGTQIEYMAPDGRSFLWYPGNRAVVQGKWHVRRNKAQGFGEICFQYGPHTYNPVTRQSGGRLNCMGAGDFILVEDEYTRGDPFNLASGTLPFVMQKKREYSLVKIGKSLGRPVTLSK